METKFTKEKWLRDGTTVYALHQKGWVKGKPLMTNRFYLQVYPDYNIPEAKEESEANAKLIAAAPDLLNALIEVRQNLRDYGYPWLVGINDKEITKVIKKATE